METVAHWTQRSTHDFVYSISSGFTSQLEMRMEERNINRSELAARTGKTTGRISQLFNDPGNLSLTTIVEYAHALGLKTAVLTYDDSDPSNNKGPINPEVFLRCWELADKPNDLFEVEDAFGLNAMQNFGNYGTARINVNPLAEVVIVQTSTIDNIATATQKQERAA